MLGRVLLGLEVIQSTGNVWGTMQVDGAANRTRHGNPMASEGELLPPTRGHTCALVQVHNANCPRSDQPLTDQLTVPKARFGQAAGVGEGRDGSTFAKLLNGWLLLWAGWLLLWGL